jgi:pimeloyl-ACP methyl ester carboxylesterase
VTTPDEHADDLQRLISLLGAGPTGIFATSGGAVNALAFAARYPEQVRTLVAHEPPAAQALPDRQALLAACTDIRQTYQSSGFGPAMAKLIVLAGYQGLVATDYGHRPRSGPGCLLQQFRPDTSRHVQSPGWTPAWRGQQWNADSH